jgi:hypothetical protein
MFNTKNAEELCPAGKQFSKKKEHQRLETVQQHGFIQLIRLSTKGLVSFYSESMRMTDRQKRTGDDPAALRLP